MVEVRYGGRTGRRIRLAEQRDLVAVRTWRPTPLSRTPLSTQARQAVAPLECIERFPDAGVEVLHGPRGGAQAAREILKTEPEVRFAGRVLSDRGVRAPVVYTENLFIKFQDDAKESSIKRLLRAHKLKIKRTLGFARNAYFLEAPDGIGRGVFEEALALLQQDAVALCHPELVRRIAYHQAFPQQWHLQRSTVNGRVVDAHASVAAAWDLSEGDGTVIAVIDDGVDIDHEEFLGAGKVVAPRDARHGTGDPRPVGDDNHGTACAGVACANGAFGASGVAPKARLMPIRLRAGLGSMAEAEAFEWAARNGADVISCSWGPADGRWWDPSDPQHKVKVPLPDSTRLAIDFATEQGRDGRGCVIAWAAGNGNESVDNDGYASYERVIAVAACNDAGTRSAYSDFGKAIWCSFPSSHGQPSLTPGIWTTDRMGGAGYNGGDAALGDSAGNYTNSFGGTSSACPGVAGVAALVLARNPQLRWNDVKDLLRRACDGIDPSGGQYDGQGHSAFYGYGRLNAQRAVELAMPVAAGRRVLHQVFQDLGIEDMRSTALALSVAETEPPRGVRIQVEIEHSYVGDLRLRLSPPHGNAILLRDREGGAQQNLKVSFDAVGVPGLAALAGANPAGAWQLEVTDTARRDTGLLRSFAVELEY